MLPKITGICKHLEIKASKEKDFVRFPSDSMTEERKTSRFNHTFVYQFLYDGKPAYKHSFGEEIYLYYNGEVNDGEWIVSVANCYIVRSGL